MIVYSLDLGIVNFLEPDQEIQLGSAVPLVFLDTFHQHRPHIPTQGSQVKVSKKTRNIEPLRVFRTVDIL